MSDDFEIDNSGSGFDLGDEDLEKLMEEARAGEDPGEDEDTSQYFRPEPLEEYGEESTTAEVGESQEDDSQVRVDFEDDFSDLDAELTDDNNTGSPTGGLVEDPEDYVSTPERVEEDTESEPSVVDSELIDPVSDTSESEVVEDSLAEDAEIASTAVGATLVDAALVGRVLRIIDEYRKLKPEEQKVVSQFLNEGVVIEDESELVVAVLNVDPLLTKIMRALREGRELDPVDRAFYIIDLEDDVLRSLGSLMSVFGHEEISEELPHSKYAREVVNGIDSLGNDAMGLVNATEAVLSAGEVSSG